MSTTRKNISLFDTGTKPFLKWAGGKSKVLNRLKNYFPINGKRFIEMFVGSGVISLNVDYPNYIINDLNKDLIATYKALQNDSDHFITECKKLFIPENNTKDQYYNNFRSEFNLSKDEFRRACLFIYLNRHCFNGICRYNSDGEFNVSVGEYDEPYFPENELRGCVDKIKKFQIYNLDFRTIFSMIQENDVVYCDPPYVPVSESSNFSNYTGDGFGLQDHIDLAELSYKASEKGATVVLSNHYNWYTRELYTKMFPGKIEILKVSRTVSGKSESRKPIEEIIAVFPK